MKQTAVRAPWAGRTQAVAMGSLRAFVTGPLVSTLHVPRGRIRMRVQRAALSVDARSRDVMRRTLRAVLDSAINELSSSPAFHRLIDEVVQYLAHHPDVEALIHEQTTSFVEDAVDDLRAGAARADTAVDRALLALRRRVRRKS
jgi:hypothetical protein